MCLKDIYFNFVFCPLGFEIYNILKNGLFGIGTHLGADHS